MEEHAATLDDVLALLDALEPPLSPLELSSVPLDEATSSSSDLSASNSSETAVGNVNATSSILSTRVSRNEAGYTTQLQRRKRAEIAGLREESRELEARLALLRRMSSLAGAEGVRSEEEGSTLKGWARLEKQAADELRARRRAEVANKQLRARLDSHAKLMKDIRCVIDKHRRRESSSGEQLVLPASPPEKHSPVNEVLPDGMRDKLQTMYEQVDAVFATEPGSPCSLETRPLPDGAEIRTCTTAAYCITDAEALLWRKEVVRKNDNGGEFRVVDPSGPDKDSYVSRFLMQTPHQSSQISGNRPKRDGVLHVEHFGRRFREVGTGSVVIVMLALIRMPPISDGVLLREFWWTRIDPVKNANRFVTTAQTYYRIGVGDPIPSDQIGVRVDVMRALVLLTRQNHVMIQNWLLEAADAW